VKNQYFGDRRDLLKYSLLETLATGLSGIDQLTCIWLLTPPAANNDGNRLIPMRQDAMGLELFLRQCVVAGSVMFANWQATWQAATYAISLIVTIHRPTFTYNKESVLRRDPGKRAHPFSSLFRS